VLAHGVYGARAIGKIKDVIHRRLYMGSVDKIKDILIPQPVSNRATDSRVGATSRPYFI
jgi:hypothetical protein